MKPVNEVPRSLAGQPIFIKKLNVSAEKLEEAKEQLKAGAEEFYKDYDAATDQKILVEMLRLYNQNLTPDWIPEEVQLANRKKGIEAYVQNAFSLNLYLQIRKIR